MARRHSRAARLRSLSRRCAMVLVLVVGVAAPMLATPASACACGALFTTNGATIDHETAAIRWDGTTEDLVVSMDMLGSTPDAGWVMPVPAQATVAVSDIALLDELAERTRPDVQRVTNWWPNLDFIDKLGIGADNTSSGAAQPTVSVLEQKELGPYTVAQIAAKDTAALTAWLTTNGYSLPAALGAAMTPYADANWVFVAVKLTAPDPTQPFTGRLQPLRLTFPSSEPVYPERLSQVATTPQSITLFVIAPDRMDVEFSPVQGTQPTLQFAGVIDPANISAISRVGQWVTQKSYLVRYDQTIADPSQITSDYTFTKAPANTEFRAVVYTERDLGWLTGGLLSVLGLVLLAVIPSRIVYRRRVRRERAAEMAEGY